MNAEFILLKQHPEIPYIMKELRTKKTAPDIQTAVKIAENNGFKVVEYRSTSNSIIVA